MEGDERVKTFHAERTFRGKRITADATVTENGVQIGLFGGDKPHIGAVGILDPNGAVAVTEFEGHKEGILCRQWCEALAKAGCTPAVVSAGVHYDKVGKEEIVQVVQLCDELWKELSGNLCPLQN